MLLDRRIDVDTRQLTPAQVPAETLRQIEQFLYQEARLLDERRFWEWDKLFTDTGMYWVPHKHEQANPFDHISLFWENRMLREVRIRRVENARNWSQQPQTQTAHLVGNVMVEGLDAQGLLVVSASFQYSEWRLEQRQLAGRYTYKLAARDGGGWQIQLKRVDLINCNDVFANLEVFV
ncbi:MULTISPECIES: aromatic-ring-hydroxylating dioxygenase subunit beta [Pseudomonas]|uniref:aromatic-ring-hydroxylating dioxygenase subunit beta n=1 Tax=Pseudomonas TaxID=286 RepID=UPI000D3A2745|nr:MULTISPECIES: aromatic-ring-hydroxylating dioxygenase subunit beta [Pseudomonas]VVQ24943.1 Benzene 1,2-dioxygenase subunit beta [Pseudomonas fluorescens]